MQGDRKSKAVMRPLLQLNFRLQRYMLKWRTILQKLCLKGTMNTEHDWLC